MIDKNHNLNPVMFTIVRKMGFHGIGIAVVFMRYLILTWLNQGFPIPETGGQLFFRLHDEFHECTFAEALEVVLRELKKTAINTNELLFISLRDFIASLSPCFRPLQALLSCET